MSLPIIELQYYAYENKTFESWIESKSSCGEIVISTAFQGRV